jgi:hypothetical protein
LLRIGGEESGGWGFDGGIVVVDKAEQVEFGAIA